MKRITTVILLALAIGNGTLAADDKGEAATLKGLQTACAKVKNNPANIDFLKEVASYAKSIGDCELKASVAATYALGMHANGQSDAANSTVQYLRETFPASPSLALFDAARYKIKCPKCNGSGQVQVPCKRCGGKRRCSGCNGRGSIERIGGTSEVCSFCRGSGECAGCRGTGHETAKCTKCFGARRIVSRQLMREALIKQVEATRKLAFVHEQKANGLVEFGGRWLTPQEKTQEVEKQTALAKAQAAEAERRLAEERRKQAEAETRLAQQQRQQAEVSPQEQAQQAQRQQQVTQPRAAERSSEPQPRSAVRSEDFDSVLIDPDKYKGQTIRSRVQLTYTMPDKNNPFISVHGPGLSEDQILGCTMSVAEKAMRVLEVKGEHAVVTIIYKVTEPRKVPLNNRKRIDDSGIIVTDLSL